MMTKFNKKLFRLAIFLSFAIFSTTLEARQTASRDECFPFERLPAAERKAAENLLLKALDEAALYTIVGGLKPMSSGFQPFQLQIALPRIESAEAEKTLRELAEKKPEEMTDDEKRRLAQSKSAVERRQTLDRINETRIILEHWRCGDEIFADEQHFMRPFDGKRFFDAIVFSRPALSETIREKSDFFSRWGITPNSHPLAVLYAVDADQTGARFGGYGYLFGYPDYAVNFFVESAAQEEFTGKFVQRDFYSIPTFARETNSFVYAVPKNHAETETDKILRSRAERILNAYKKRRAQYIGAGKKGVVELMRDWFCAKTGDRCSPRNAEID